jgi:hypothetical protein
LEPARPIIRAVVGALLALSPERLELIARLRYLYRDQKASGTPGPWKELNLEGFWAPGNFTTPFLSSWTVRVLWWNVSIGEVKIPKPGFSCTQLPT